jgi:hypothetical protein
MMNKKGILDGLEVRNGRLINNAPDGMTGIQKLAMVKKARRIEEKTMIMERDVQSRDASGHDGEHEG